MKFGGTSVKDRAAIERLIGIVRAERQSQVQPERGDLRGPAVVVSALAGVTDRLLGLAAEANAGDAEGASQHIRALRERHHEVAGVILDAALRRPVDHAIDLEFDELDRVVKALSVLRELSPRRQDLIAATGEILSSQIVAAALTSHGLDAVWVDARQVIVTNDDFNSAVPDTDKTNAALQRVVDPHLSMRRIPVIGGFVGATEQGETTTLGRGGSDYSGALVGAGLGADEIQIWTDVDGMLTADPRIINNPHVVLQLSFPEASELASFGAKVLHPSTIQPAISRNIPVRILNSQRPAARGTLITAEGPTADRPFTAIASKVGVTVVSIVSTRMLDTAGFLSGLFKVFEDHDTSVDVVTTSEVSVSVTVDDTRRLPGIVAKLSKFAEVSCHEKMAIVCAVGGGVKTNPSMAAETLAAIAGIPVRMVSQSALQTNITVVISQSDLPEALNRLHAKFFGNLPDNSTIQGAS